MLYAEFLPKVRVRGRMPRPEESRARARTVLSLLGTQLDQDQVRDVTHSVPEQVAKNPPGIVVRWSPAGFLATVAGKRRSGTLESAR